MNEKQFKFHLDELQATNSRKEKKQTIRELQDSTAAISFLSGSEFNDAGLGKKTVLSVAQEVFPEYDLDGQPTVSDELAEYETDVHTEGLSLSQLREKMTELAELSGNEQKEKLKVMFETFEYPSLVSFACLNDLGTGVSDTTIANALDCKDSLPFYESVVDIVEAPGQLTQPQVGRAFSPMLAKSESNLPDSVEHLWGQPKLDGYRLLIHVKEEEIGQIAYAFTRRMNDVTESLPELQEVDWPDGEYIFDCEVMAEDGTYKSTSERVGRDAENVERDVDMEFGLFDILVEDGTHVGDRPYKERYELLHKVGGRANDVAMSTHLSEEPKVWTLPIFDGENAAHARIISRSYEGLIWKDPDAPYEYGKRSSSWVKEKNTGETVDVVATDFEEGEGRLDGTLGKIHLETDDGVYVGATGSGFSDEQRDEVWENRDEYRGTTLEVEAEAFDEALRFPIFQRWRTDDGEPDTLERVENILPEP